MALRNILPWPLLSFYHLAWAFIAAVFYRFPSRHLVVIGVTGTKGKTTVTEMLSKILEEAGLKVAVANGLHFKISDREEPNLLKMTMPGRGKLQKFLSDALKAGCTHAIIEVTSEGIKQHRQRFIKFDVAALTNLQKEHIEAHGSFEAYRAAKGALFWQTKDIHVINTQDPNAAYFKKFPSRQKILYSRQDATNLGLQLQIPGEFNLMNAVCAAVIARALGIKEETIRKALKEFKGVAGRMEFIQKEPFQVIIDYAHTPDSLEAVYKTIKNSISQDHKMICVLGAAGGGRDKWKRPVMGEIASRYCDEIFLTNEDPYDEPPEKIISDIQSGITNYQLPITHVILDRKEAIRNAILAAKPGDAVIITGKGAERFMVMGNKKIPWQDAEIAKEILIEIRRNL
jgi:UDP-N-acetylmuramoyl-L-alanyl-D-glutamate--2,6-diaminopimelate ligase